MARYVLYESKFYADLTQIRLILDRAEIPYFLGDELATVTLGISGGFADGIRVLVEDVHFKEAATLLLNEGYLKEEDLNRQEYFDSEVANKLVHYLRKNGKKIAIYFFVFISLIVILYLILGGNN